MSNNKQNYSSKEIGLREFYTDLIRYEKMEGEQPLVQNLAEDAVLALARRNLVVLPYVIEIGN